MPAPTMTLAEAMRRNGIDAPDPAFDSVAVTAAPGWLRKVWPKGVKAMALPRRIYVSAEALARIAAGEAGELIRHEAVHVDQWRREGWIGFLAKYLAAYLKGRAAGLPHSVAYRAIPFEREASSTSE